MAERPDHQIEELLQRLNTADAGAAWAAFIDRYSAVIIKVISQFEYDQDRHAECFLYVCEKLSERQFRRLQQFNVAGKASFRNWLGTVVFNLSVDWHRTEFGRATISPAIAALPAFDQLVYQHYYQQGMNRDTCFNTLRSDFPELTMDQITASLTRIHALLTPRQRWQLNVRNMRRSGKHVNLEDLSERRIEDPCLGPESHALSDEESATLHAALDRLTTDQRLLLHLRFQEGLTFQRIAEIEHLGDTHRARRHVQTALDALYRAFEREKQRQKRQN